ncbi:LysR family transcriptional regulator [Vibrio nomapromontoriensis]|uniref:LysR family transcriptional regulator n=1 Tax=Vibrio nomapromontoriensis TaxID=2910246 RepID=UPI003D0F8906
MDKLRALRYFKRVVELRSFSKVAAEVDVPPSSISRRIKDLENELGIELIQRTTRQVKATELGTLYYQQIVPGMKQLDDADELISQRKEAMVGKLRISVSTSFGERVLLPTLHKFRQQYPNITLDIDFSDKVVNFTTDPVDIAIRAGQLTQDRIVAKPLSSSAFKLVATPKLATKLMLSYGKNELSVDDLQTIPTLQYQRNKEILPWWAYQNEKWTQLTLVPAFSCNNGEALMHATLAGEGIALFPEWWVRPYLRDGSLVEVPTCHPISNGQTSNLDIFIVYQSAKYQIPKIRTCIDFILDNVD